MKFHWALMLLSAISGSVVAQDELPAARRGELGVRYWLTSGESRHSHNAQGLIPALGNPTSVLTYEDLKANVFELFGRGTFARHWFLKGTLGYGQINTGSLDDEDYFAGQLKVSDSTSTVTEGRIGYGTIDLGRQWVLSEGRLTLGAFAGYAQWTEYADAYGGVYTTDLIGDGSPISGNVKVVSNKLTWKALRVGFAGEVALGRARFGLDLAFVPYAEARNEDSHHLRADPDDLGPVPNILIKAKYGWGVQADAELRYEIRRRTELGIGVRYWYLKSTEGERSVAGIPEVPIVEIYSERVGVTASLRWTW